MPCFLVPPLPQSMCPAVCKERLGSRLRNVPLSIPVQHDCSREDIPQAVWFSVVFKVLLVMSVSTALGRLSLQKNHFAVGTLVLTPEVRDTKGGTIPYKAGHSSRNV